nr:gag pol polyprotein [Hymenolepis microstoma]
MREIAAELIYKRQHFDVLFINDRKTDIRFLIDSGSQCCFIPTSCFSWKKWTPFQWIRADKGKDIAIYGHLEIVVDLGLGREMKWTFVIADINTPIIGTDFLVYYDLQIDLRLKKLVSTSNAANENDLANGDNGDLASIAYRRPFIYDRNSGINFLIDSGAHRSQIPYILSEILDPIPYSRYLKANGSTVIEFGYKYLTLDLGLEMELPWNFLMTDNNVPIIGADFLAHYGLSIDLRRGKLLRTQNE